MSQNLARSVTLITSSSDAHSRNFGTGFAIYQDERRTYLLTCAHVVRDVGGSEQIKANGLPATVIASGNENSFDLAVLRVEVLRDKPPLKLHATGKEEKPFIIPGFYDFDQKNTRLLRRITGNLGEQTELSSSDGRQRINAWDLMIEGEHYLEPGYSGSPVIDKETGFVLGVVSHRIGNGEKGLAISIEALKEVWSEMPLSLVGEGNISSSSEDSRSIKANLGASQILERGEVFANIIDATFYIQRQKELSPRENLRENLRNKRFLPCHYFYITDSGYENWVRLCNHPRYRFYHESITFFNENKNRILEALGNATIQEIPDYISLGTGDGCKDQILLEAFIERVKGNDMYYYPYDINPTMISKAIQQISTNDNIFQRIKTKAIVADFDNLQDFRPVYEYRSAPNIFAFLGNTLGSYENEFSLLDSIKNAMNTNDILLLEVRLLAGFPRLNENLRPDGDLELTKKFNFEPLAVLGIRYERHRLSYRRTKRSHIDNTSTICSFYRARIPEITPQEEEIPLSWVNYYDENALSIYLHQVFNFHIEATIKNPSNTLALYVLRK